MACLLTKDQNGIYDAWGTADDAPTVTLRSDASALVVVSAHFAGLPVALTPDGKIPLPAMKHGTNVLTCVIEGLAAGDDVELVEDCSDPTVLARKFVGNAPGGADPIVSFSIHAA